MKREELVETLRDTGLSPYQAETYVSILDMGSGTAMDIAEASGVPDPRIYDVLRDLEEEGYVELYEQDTLRARARDPEEVMEMLSAWASRLEAATDAIEERWEQEGIEETTVSIVSRFETVLEEAERAIDEAEYHVRVCVSPSQLPELSSVLEGAVERGVHVNLTLYTPEEDAEELPGAERLAPLCSETRHRPMASPFVTLVDRSKTCFFPHSGSIEVYGVLVNDRAYARVFHWFFVTQMWNTWETIYRREDDSPHEYVDIRDCIGDLGPLLKDDVRVELEVEGTDVTTGRERTVEGVLLSIATTGLPEESSSELVAQYAGKVALTVETEDGIVEIGGRGATLEDIEARRIRVTRLERG
jgi:sugar-specific transcriptional regulator TrmB